MSGKAADKAVRYHGSVFNEQCNTTEVKQAPTVNLCLMNNAHTIYN